MKGLDKYPLDGPIPEMGDTNGPLSRQRLLLEQGRRDKLTLWQLCLANAGPRGHVLSIGTPAQVADEMEHWFKDGAADGFNVMPAWLPGSLKDFVELVVPELQRRGLFRTEYEATTLRGNLGLPTPVNRHHAQRSDAAQEAAARTDLAGDPVREVYMKAVVIHATGGPEQLTVADMPDPAPGPGEVLLDVAYAGCNWADT